MRIGPSLFSCILAAFASSAAAAGITCDNEKSIAEVNAQLEKSCAMSVVCKARQKTVRESVESFRAGKMTLQHCSSTLNGIYESEKTQERLRQVPPSQRPGGGGGGGGGAPFGGFI